MAAGAGGVATEAPPATAVSSVPEDRLYSAAHAWVRRVGARAIMGISDFAQSALGELVFVRLPAPGVQVHAGAPLGEVESLKSTSELYAPVSGRVAAVNAELGTRPELVNADPYGAGWLCEIEVVGEDDAVLLSAEEYRARLGEDD